MPAMTPAEISAFKLATVAAREALFLDADHITERPTPTGDLTGEVAVMLTHQRTTQDAA